ncbi:MAG TPA: HAMP domain-containing sensor histidine kinase [Saprospiraceae bacterium]|nr:HAMP domain-containing sensor histidine kinase [Saprospiraceae bacterium]
MKHPVILKHFFFGILVRLILMVILMYFIVHLHYINDFGMSFVLLLIALIYLFMDLLRAINGINEKVAKFLDSVKYADFAYGFTGDSSKGSTYKELNRAFHQVLEVFRKTRMEKEEQLLFVSTVLDHIQTGIISFDEEGKIGVCNRKSKELLNITNIRFLHDLESTWPDLCYALIEMESGSDTLVKINAHLQLSLKMTSIKLRGKLWKLVSIHNIYSELEQNELEAWQNLTRVLRHEIMNSVTPVSSLIGSLQSILSHEVQKNLDKYEMEDEVYEDFAIGLKTIEKRSEGLLRFVQAYRTYTDTPKLYKEVVNISEVIEESISLWHQELNNARIKWEYSKPDQILEVYIDRDLVHQVFSNIIKNAIEALIRTEKPVIEVSVRRVRKNLEVQFKDNGSGINPSELEKIFVPFYTTKANGSGIGLALSRQIVHLHGGSIRVESKPGNFTTFIVKLPTLE